MFQEVKEYSLADDVDMCLKQTEDILSSVEETKRVIRDRYYDGSGCGINTSLYKDDIEIIQRLDMIWSRTKQLESMMKYSCDVSSKRQETETTCISPWFFIAGAVLILCRKKM